MKPCHALLAALTLLVMFPFSAHAQARKPDKMPFAVPIQRQVADAVECAGRAHAATSVTMVPRVTGYVVQILVKEGDNVKTGDVLFKIDPRPYQAQVDAELAHVAQSEANLRYAKVTNLRFQELDKRVKGAVSALELEQYQAQESIAIAGLNLAKANLETARINLDWTVVQAPVDGRVGRHLLTLGALVKQDVTQLTTIASLDLMHVHFDLDDLQFLQIRRAVEDGKIAHAGPGPTLKVQMRLAGEDGYPHEGIVNLSDSQAASDKDSVSMRASFANPRTPKGNPLLIPGLVTRLQITIGQPRAALLIADGLARGKALPKVYVLNGNAVETRTVKLGQLQADGLRVIEEGLKKDDRVYVGGDYLGIDLAIQPEQIQEVVMPTRVQGPQTFSFPSKKGKGGLKDNSDK